MSSENDNSYLVDLLYDDELDDETARDEARRRVEESDEAGRELEANEAFLEELRENTDRASVSSQLHDAIVDHARREADARAETSAADRARPDSRGPRQAPDEGSSLWTRIDRSSLTQLAAAAVAIMASGYLLYNMSADRSPEGAAEQPRMAQRLPESDQPAESEKTAQKAAEAEEDDTDRLAKAEDRAEAPEPAAETEESAASEKDDSLAGEELARAPTPPRDEPTRQRKAPRQRAKSAETERKKAKSEGLDALQDKSSAPAPKKKTQPRGRARADSKPAPSTPTADLFGADSDDSSADNLGYAEESAGPAEAKTREQQAAEKPASDEKTAANKQIADNKALGEMLQGKGAGGAGKSAGFAEDAESEPTQQAQQAQQAQQPAEPEAAEPRADRPADGIDALVERVETAYQDRSWSDVADMAQKALPRTSGRQAARLRELRARALAARGDADAALQAWQTLRKKHPDYKAETVQQEIDSLRTPEK